MNSTILLVTLILFINPAKSWEYCKSEIKSKLCPDKGGTHIVCDSLAAIFDITHKAETFLAHVPLTRKVKESFTNWHNYFRHRIASGKAKNAENSKHFPVSSRMREIIWDNELAFLSHHRTQLVVMGEDTCHATQRFPYAGQNIAVKVMNDYKPVMEVISLAINEWFNGKDKIDDPEHMENDSISDSKVDEPTNTTSESPENITPMTEAGDTSHTEEIKPTTEVAVPSQTEGVTSTPEEDEPSQTEGVTPTTEISDSKNTEDATTEPKGDPTEPEGDTPSELAKKFQSDLDEGKPEPTAEIEKRDTGETESIKTPTMAKLDDPKEPEKKGTPEQFKTMVSDRVSRLGCAVALGSNCKDKDSVMYSLCYYVACTYDYGNSGLVYKTTSSGPATECSSWGVGTSKMFKNLCGNSGEIFDYTKET